ncbi:MAG: dehydrogenase, partial [Paucibacter sp.]|nr:dehydrogenase [Roseateles sp.]
MPHMLLIVEPLGQRAERGREAGEAVYQRMVDFSAELQAAGLLLGVNSLGTAAKRLSKRDGGTQVWDGPFAEAKEVLGGFWIIDVPSRAAAIEWATRCPGGENEVIEVRQIQEV